MHRSNEEKIVSEIGDEQYSFMPNKATQNAISMMRMLSERTIEIQQKLYLCFLNYRKVLDQVNDKKYSRC